MATPFAPAGLLPAAPAAPRRAGRWRGALLLAAAVGAWHAWLVGQLAPDAPPAGARAPALVQLRSLTPAGPPPPAQPTDPLPVAQAAAPAAAPAHAAPRSLPAVATRPAVPSADEAIAAAPAAPVADATAHTAADPVAEADAGPEGMPPPLYATRLPPPAQLHYRLQLNGQTGDALLVWQHDGQRYRLTLDSQSPAGNPLLMQASAGGLDAHGLAPDRYVDRRRTGRTQAASFRRDIGRIGYSGPPQQHPAWPGAQDRLSWLVQVVAILAAAAPPPDALQLFVTDARGHAGLWSLQRLPDETAATPWGDAWLQRWQREPPRPEGLRVDVWLPVADDGPAGPWPLRLRLVVPRSGDVLELQRTAPP